MKSIVQRSVLAVGVALSLALTAGCTAPDSGPPDTAPTDAGPSATPSAQASDPASTVEPTCETILTPAMTRGLLGLGWTAQSTPFIIGDQELDGMLCKWADFDAPNSTEVQIYGWARIDATHSVAAQDLLAEQGWKREQTDQGVLLSEDAAFAVIVDEQGYGMSYLFGDGWVIVADTRQNLLLIDRPE